MSVLYGKSIVTIIVLALYIANKTICNRKRCCLRGEVTESMNVSEACGILAVEKRIANCLFVFAMMGVYSLLRSNYVGL
jgi:hypothetical protein